MHLPPHSGASLDHLVKDHVIDPQPNLPSQSANWILISEWLGKKVQSNINKWSITTGKSCAKI